MISSFEYRSPRSVEEALELLARHQEEAKILAGGHSLIPAMKHGDCAPAVLIDLRRIEGLSSIEPFAEGGFRVGALVTHRGLERSELVRSRAVILSEAASQAGDAQVRNFGTLVGSVCHSDPAADYPAVLLALDAQVIVASPRGERSVPIDGFLQGPFQTALEPDELVVAVDLLRSWASTGAYCKVRRSAISFALAGVAIQVALEEGRIAEARIGVTGVSDRPFRASSIEAQLRNHALESDGLSNVLRDLAHDRNVLPDPEAAADYRSHLADVCARRAMQKALSRFGE